MQPETSAKTLHKSLLFSGETCAGETCEESWTGKTCAESIETIILVPAGSAGINAWNNGGPIGRRWSEDV